jgi:hypothetical protein
MKMLGCLQQATTAALHIIPNFNDSLVTIRCYVTYICVMPSFHKTIIESVVPFNASNVSYGYETEMTYTFRMLSCVLTTLPISFLTAFS